jgi:hypothetical protein
MKRNLFYNCFAPKWTSCSTFDKEEWELNVEHLCKYAHIFNNRKIVIIRESSICHPPEEVEARFAPLGSDVEFVRLPNNPELGEVAGWVETLARLKSLDENEITFYAHTKGVKYHDQKEEFMRGVRKWREDMYDQCLGNINLIERVMSEYACAGCFRQDSEMIASLLKITRDTPLPMEATWQFAGTFWWVNHKELFSKIGEKGWNFTFPCFHGIEGYLGRLFPIERSYCLYKDSVSLFNHLFSSESFCKSCANPIDHAALCYYCGMWQTEPPQNLSIKRQDVINKVINKYSYSSYLEIGLGGQPEKDRCFPYIKAATKASVDSEIKDATYLMTSDEFFSNPGASILWDIIFLDGSHCVDQVRRDIDNSLNHLNPNGTLVVHDCNPLAEIAQQVPLPKGLGIWNGNVWKAWAWYRMNRPDLSMCVVDVDFGCGIIKRGSQKLFPKYNSELNYDFLEKNRKVLLNLISWTDW